MLLTTAIALLLMAVTLGEKSSDPVKIMESDNSFEMSGIAANHALCNIAQELKINILFYPNWTCDSKTTSDMICMWRGVTCQYGVVVKLVLSWIGLKSSIPTSIGSLPHLTNLNNFAAAT